MNCSRRSLLVLSILFVAAAMTRAQADPGDTTTVRVFDNYLWTWNGGQNRWAVFPDSATRDQKILMHFRLKCPTGGCGEWDYTMSVYALVHTGRIDSSIQKAPSFRVDGAVRDSVPVSFDTTYTTRWNAALKRTDLVARAALKVTLYGDAANPFRATDSLTLWPAGYYNPVFDTTGATIDSSYVQPDSILRVTQRDIWVPFEVVDQYEIGRFITPYGKWFAKDREFDWVYDVTDYKSLLTDSTEIKVFYDGWSQGSLFTLDFNFVEGIPARDVFLVRNLYTGGFTYGDPANPIEEKLPEKTVRIDPRSTYTSLRITTTGHGFGGTENAAEFSDKTHSVLVNGVPRFSQHLWRDDCGQNPVYPQAGTWYYQRGGWCPGDKVGAFDFDLTPWVVAGSDARIDYNMQPYTNEEPSHPATYFVQAQLLFATGPNFRNDVELYDIRRPTDAFHFRRLNPICSGTQPEIIIRNVGGDTLRTLSIDYGTNGSLAHHATWQGRLGFLDTVSIVLPPIELGADQGTFTVTLSDPNGTTDERASNNTMTSHYVIPKKASNVIYFSLRTDDFFDDADTYNGISYEVIDASTGQQLYYRDGFADRTIYRDTFRLADGCYQFIIHDDAVGDGLIPIRGTSGSYLLRDDKSQTIVNGTGSPNYLASFGNREITPFIVSSTTGVGGETESMREMEVFPNPTTGTVTVDLRSLRRSQPGVVAVYGIEGDKIQERRLGGGEDLVTLSMAGRAAGVYTVRVTYDGASWSRRFVLGE